MSPDVHRQASQTGVTESTDKFASSSGNTAPRPADADKNIGRRASVVEGKRGRPRRGRSMGRYPFLESAKQYLERRRAFFAKSTYEELERKMRYLNKVFVDLARKGEISTTNPKNLTYRDVSMLILYMRDREHSNSYIAKNLGFINQVCDFVGNPVFAKIRAEGERFPSKTPKELHPLSRDDLRAVANKAEGMEGWWGAVTRFLVSLYPYTGLRPSELRLAHIEDVDIKRWTMYVRHPKGENRYGRKRTVPILPPARDAVKNFLMARRERLREMSIGEAEPLIPARHGNEVGYYSSNTFRWLKKKVSEAVDREFSLKTFRDTYCQQNIDACPELLSDVSRTMGHATTRTTETYYGRIREEQALERLQRFWEQRSGNTPLINTRYEMSGYA